jgi:hypothetical protein
MTELVARTPVSARARPTIGGLLIVERNAMVYRRTWMIIFSGFFEPSSTSSSSSIRFREFRDVTVT